MALLEKKDFIMVECAERHTFFLTINGQLLAAGTSICGELGCFAETSKYTLEEPTAVQGVNRIRDVASSTEHTLAIDYDTGDLYGWGRVALGKIGLGTDKQARQNIPALIQNFKSKENAQPKFQMVACSSEFSLALDTYGGLWYAGFKYFDGHYGTEGSLW